MRKKSNGRRARFVQALDWRRIPPVEDDSEDIVGENETRLARMAAFIRLLMVPFLAIPLFVMDQLEHPALAVAAFAGSLVEGVWYARRAWRRGSIRDDWVIVAVDVLFCIALMSIGSRAATPELRNEVMTEVIPFSLVAALTVGFAIGLSWKSVGLILAMWIAWFFALLPDITQKFGSDLLGFVMWFLVGLYVSTLLRSLATRTALVTAQRRAVERELARLRHHEQLHQGLHDGGVLSVLDALATNEDLPPDARHAARHGGLMARDLLTSRGDASPLEARLRRLADAFTHLGLRLECSFFIRAEPPAHVTEKVVPAVNEALNNALKYAGKDVEVILFAEFGDGELNVSVLDHGVGFDLATVSPGGGLSKSFRAVRAVGAVYRITSAPGEGTQVTFTWMEEAHAGWTADRPD